MARRRRSAHQQLDEHRQRVASEGTKFRELQEQQAQADAEVKRSGDAIARAYASEDEREIATTRKGKEEATARVEDVAHRAAGEALLRRPGRALGECLGRAFLAHASRGRGGASAAAGWRAVGFV